ncbi:MAG: hypothetical protein IKW85_11315 [Muribaculaceae bacterium]|nr:hypothetical protein [Muribaculaceae bacterium]
MKQKARILLTIAFAVISLAVSAGGWLQVTGNSVRLRWSPGGKDTGMRMYKGQKLQWYDYSNGWYSVNYSGNIVYISSQYVKRINQDQNNAVVVVNGDRVILRLAPGGKDSGIRAYNGNRFPYCGQSGDWNKIKYNGKYYWVSKKYSLIVQ